MRAPVDVELTGEERNEALEEAWKQFQRYRKGSESNADGGWRRTHEEKWRDLVTGAVGARASYKLLRYDWRTMLETYHDPDIEGTDIQLRSTLYWLTAYLRFRPESDNRAHRFLLIGVRDRRYCRIYGWRYGWEVEAIGARGTYGRDDRQKFYKAEQKELETNLTPLCRPGYCAENFGD
jgi:hypothetical protein